MEKNKKLSEPIKIALALFVMLIVAFTIMPISELVDKEMSKMKSLYLKEQLVESKLPEKTDMLEEIHYSGTGDYRVILLLKSDLSEEKISEYYQKLKIKPVNNGDEIQITIIGPKQYQERFNSSVQMYEHVAGIGSFHKYKTVTSYKDNYVIFLAENQKS